MKRYESVDEMVEDLNKKPELLEVATTKYHYPTPEVRKRSWSLRSCR